MATINIKELSEADLKQKIKNTRYEVNRVSAALKRYEEELERRKKEIPLGVPLEDKTLAHHFGVYELGFTSEESLCLFDRRIKDYVEALQKLARGELIDIKVLCPLLKKGWVAMDKNGTWYWYESKPIHDLTVWVAEKPASYLSAFNIKPAENWEDSLMECGL